LSANDPPRGEDSGEPARITLGTPRGDIHCLYHPAAGATAAVLWVGGTGGGFAGPAGGMYPLLAARLATAGIASLRLDYRNPNSLAECMLDVLAGVRLLERRAIAAVALVGHSFGGAVVIRAALYSPTVKAVVTIASQNGGTQGVERLAPRPLLLVHGAADNIIPPAASQEIYARAAQPKELVLRAGAGHLLAEDATGVQQLVADWLLRQLQAPRA